jgi:hypothetical protein
MRYVVAQFHQAMDALFDNVLMQLCSRRHVHKHLSEEEGPEAALVGATQQAFPKAEGEFSDHLVRFGFSAAVPSLYPLNCFFHWLPLSPHKHPVTCVIPMVSVVASECAVKSVPKKYLHNAQVL